LKLAFLFIRMMTCKAEGFTLRPPVKLLSGADQTPPLPRALRSALLCTDRKCPFWQLNQ